MVNKSVYIKSLARMMLFVSALGFPALSFAQSYDSLNLLKGYKTQVYFSKDAGERAKEVAIRCDKVLGYYKPVLDVEPSAKVLVLNPADWPTYCAKGAVYGMPHYTSNQVLIVAAEDNPFWKGFVPPVSQLPKEVAGQVQKTYSDKNGNPTMKPFFDLLAIHELGHAYHNQAGVKMQRKWMGEFFPNLMLHTYIAENEPELLPALTLIPRIITDAGTKGYAFTTLAEFEEHYNDIAVKHPRNYGWYQCRLHRAAGDIYDVAGSTVVKKLWTALKNQSTPIDDAAFVNLLAGVDPSVAKLVREW